MAQEEKDITPEELEKRLDEIFGVQQPSSDASEDQQSPSPLQDLDSIMLSLDWELSEENIANFLSEVESLRNSFAEDKVASSFFKLLYSLGKYIHKRKGKTHPYAIKLLQSSYSDLRRIVESSEVSEKERKQLLYKNIEKYNELKEKISSKPVSSSRDAVKEDSDSEQSASKAALSGETSGQFQMEESKTGDEKDTRSEPGFEEGRGVSNEASNVAENLEETLTDQEPGSVPAQDVTNQDILTELQDLKALIREELRILRSEIRAQERGHQD